jgi:hypothetical protein
MKNVINVASFTSMKVMIHCTPIKSTENPLHQQCGKPYFSNTRQNGEWTEIRQYFFVVLENQVKAKQDLIGQ